MNVVASSVARYLPDLFVHLLHLYACKIVIFLLSLPVSAFVHIRSVFPHPSLFSLSLNEDWTQSSGIVLIFPVSHSQGPCMSPPPRVLHPSPEVTAQSHLLQTPLWMEWTGASSSQTVHHTGEPEIINEYILLKVNQWREVQCIYSGFLYFNNEDGFTSSSH